MKAKLPRLMIVGTGSGSGKTTVTCGILGAIKNRNIDVRAFKCGPDYIDPMFHRSVIGVPSNNLDVFLMGESNVKWVLGKSHGEFVIIEGVMGMYDGMGDSDYGSSNHVANITDTPQILVVSPKGVGLSVAATVKGYIDFRPNNIVGVIINNVSKGMYPYYKNIIEKELEVEVLGYLINEPSITVENRHLGLVTAGEIKDIKERVDRLTSMVEETVDINRLIELGNRAKDINYEEINILASKTSLRTKVALAWDEAFCFYYEENIKVLEAMGLEIVKFSPLRDKFVPNGVKGLILPGGYPELYAKELSDNSEMRESIRSLRKKNIPTIAECGGYMYLGETIEYEGESYPMVGAIKSNFHMTTALVRFGYGELTAIEDTILGAKGETITVHEFHYSDSDNNGNSFELKKRREKVNCGHSGKNIYAAYPHIHLLGNLNAAKKFCEKVFSFEV